MIYGFPIRRPQSWKPFSLLWAPFQDTARILGQDVLALSRPHSNPQNDIYTVKLNTKRPKPPAVRATNQSQHISVIYIDKVNGMECVRTRWLDCDFDSGSIRRYMAYVFGECVQKFAFLGSSADIVTRQTEVVYKELHLKSTRQCSRFPFISKELHRKVVRY